MSRKCEYDIFCCFIYKFATCHINSIWDEKNMKFFLLFFFWTPQSLTSMHQLALILCLPFADPAVSKQGMHKHQKLLSTQSYMPTGLIMPGSWTLTIFKMRSLSLQQIKYMNQVIICRNLWGHAGPIFGQIPWFYGEASVSPWRSPQELQKTVSSASDTPTVTEGRERWQTERREYEGGREKEHRNSSQARWRSRRHRT